MPEDGGQRSHEEEKQSFLDMAACMRERGYDFPDPTFDGGRVTQKLEKREQPVLRDRTTRVPEGPGGVQRRGRPGAAGQRG